MEDLELGAMATARGLATSKRDALAELGDDELTPAQRAELKWLVARRVSQELSAFQSEEKAHFIRELLEHGNIAKASAACGVSRRAALAARRRDPEFAAAWTDALEAKVDEVQQVMVERALNPSVQATVAGIFVLKHLRPEVFNVTDGRDAGAQRPQVVVVNLMPANPLVAAPQDSAILDVEAEAD